MHGNIQRAWLGAAVALIGAIGLAATPDMAAAADVTAPTQPGTITASGLTSSSVTLKWGNSTDAVAIEGYRVYRGPAGATSFTDANLIATTDAVNSYQATRLYSGTGYTFGVVAIDAANNRSAMRTTQVTTPASSDTTAPAAPAATSVSGRVFSSSRIDLVWAASSSNDTAGYQVFRDGALLGRVDLPNALRYSDAGLAAASSHVYTVKAVDSAGNISAATNGRTVKTLAAGALIMARGPYVSNVTGTAAVVSWWTNLATPGVVSWGTASPTETTRSDPAGSVQHHAVTITGLAPGTTYLYRVGNGSSLASEGRFATAALPGQPFSFAVIGDFGGGSTGETQNANAIAAGSTAFMQTVGDNIYPSAGLPDPDFNTVYSDFDARFYKPFAAAIKGRAFFPANGNKEYYGDGEFWANFPMPGSNHSFYSYDWGDAHILVLDTEQPVTPSSEQYRFAQSDLAAHQSSAWRIVALQRPPYSSTSANSSSVPVRTNLVPLFQAQHVNLVLSGNSHNYERTFPLVDGVRAAGGITYVISGAGGNGFNTLKLAQPAYSAFREDTFYQYARVSVSPGQLVVDAIRASDGSVFDSTTISKPGAGTITVTPTDDATIDSTGAATSGTSTRLATDHNSPSGPLLDFLLRFTIPSTCSTYSRALLTLTVSTASDAGSSKGGDFYAAADNGWAETTVTWDSAPAPAPSPVASLGAVSLNTPYTVDLSALVSGPGTLSIRVATTSGDAVKYVSKEGSAAQGPQLTLTC